MTNRRDAARDFGEVGDQKSWQQTKSEMTRHQILEATLDCFLIHGFRGTTTEKISKHAKVSRGAMLHHFPQRADLVKSAVEHMHLRRLQEYERDLLDLNEDSEHTLVEEGIEVFWRQLQSPLFSVYCELLVAARTDEELRATFEPAQRAFESLWQERSQAIFPDLALSSRYSIATMATRYLLEGIAINTQSQGLAPNRRSIQEIVSWLKSTVRDMLSDVEDIDREAARHAGLKPQAKVKKKNKA